MATIETDRRIDAFVMHGHVYEEYLEDYAELFQKIEAITPSDRCLEQGERQISLPTVTLENGRVRMVAYEGDKGVNPLIFNIEEGSERHTRLRNNEILATRTQAVIDCATRKVVVEYNQRGAKSSDFASMISAFGARALGNEAFNFELTPIPGDSFLEELRKYGRVQLASVKLIKPNPDWNDAEDALSGLAADSGARTFEVVMTAQRQNSLSFRHGILASIRHLVGRSHPNLKDVRIQGVKEGQVAKSTLSLLNHCEHARVKVPRGPDGYPDPAAVTFHLDQYLNQLLAPNAK
jgi:hypothetical protein